MGQARPSGRPARKSAPARASHSVFFGGFQLTDGVPLNPVDGLQKRRVIVCRQQLLCCRFIFGFNRGAVRLNQAVDNYLYVQLGRLADIARGLRLDERIFMINKLSRRQPTQVNLCTEDFSFSRRGFRFKQCIFSAERLNSDMVYPVFQTKKNRPEAVCNEKQITLRHLVPGRQSPFNVVLLTLHRNLDNFTGRRCDFVHLPA